MENITLGQISNLLLFIAELGGVTITIIVAMKKILNKQLEPINQKIDKLDLNDCKNFLVRFLADVERGQVMDEVEEKRAHDVYDHYRNDLNGNSYIEDKWNKLMK
ncbi:MAG: hypothetical protein IKL65_00310 [Bacilli bacterium]|nr:hypothetical protein [Bacilli bacterium]